MSHVEKDEVPALEDLSGLYIARKYIQSVRQNLRRISITAETTKVSKQDHLCYVKDDAVKNTCIVYITRTLQIIKEEFVEIAKKTSKETNKADLLNEFLILSRYKSL